jgi:hypothetical protein
MSCRGFAEMLIHFHFGKFPALIAPKYSKGHAEFFREKFGTFAMFWRYECQKFAKTEMNRRFGKTSATHVMYLFQFFTTNLLWVPLG